MGYLNAQPHALALFQVLLAHDISISTVVIGEVYQGIYDGYDPIQDAKDFERLLAEFAVIPFDIDVARTFGRIRGAARKLIPKPGDSDIMIAATAIHHDLILVTRNTRDFSQIADLKQFDWSTVAGLPPGT
jgi:predicted nucleic acid-binding protein